MDLLGKLRREFNVTTVNLDELFPAGAIHPQVCHHAGAIHGDEAGVLAKRFKERAALSARAQSATQSYENSTSMRAALGL